MKGNIKLSIFADMQEKTVRVVGDDGTYEQIFENRSEADDFFDEFVEKADRVWGVEETDILDDGREGSNCHADTEEQPPEIRGL